MKTNLPSLQLLFLCILTMLTGTLNVSAQTTKTTKADGLWSDPNTWTGGVIPDASNKATINNSVIIDMDINILSLTINAASSLTFDTTRAFTFTVADELIVNGLFTVAKNKVSPYKHILEVAADFYGPGSIDFYDPNGDMVELVFIGNSHSTLKDITDVTGIGGQGKFGGLTVNKSIASATVILKKSLTINSGLSAMQQGNVIIKKGILDTDSCFVQAGDNANILEIDSLTGLYIASEDIHSFNGFEQYSIHPHSTIKYYRDGDYEMTKGWTSFDGNVGNFVVAGNGIKFFGDSVATRHVYGDFTVDAGGNYSVDNDTIALHGSVTINGTLSTDNKNSLITFDSLVNVAGSGAWLAASNDWFVFRNGLTVSNDALFNGGSGLYTFTANDQEIFLQDTIPNMLVDGITLLNTDSLACDIIRGSGTLVNQYYLDITGQAIQCNLGLDSLNNKVIYSNANPQVSPFTYEILEFTNSGTASLTGDVQVRNSLIKENEGYISLGNYNLTIDTATIFKFDNPGYQKMIVTGGTGSLVKKASSTNMLVMIYPVGTITDTAAYTPFEITSVGKYIDDEKFISVNSVYGLHPGMEDTTGLYKYWTVDTDILPSDSIKADLRFAYLESEVHGDENEYEVRVWNGDEPWVEPDDWNIDMVTNDIIVTGVIDLAFDWTAGDSTALTSKVNELVFAPAPGILNNSHLVTISTSTPDVIIYYALGNGVSLLTDSLYVNPIAVDTALTITAIAFKDGWQNSDTASAVYTFMVDTVEFSIPEGSYSTAQQVELTCSTIGAEIRYTTDGSEPDETSALYAAPIDLTTSATIRAKAFRDKYLPSALSEASYTIVFSSLTEPEDNYWLKMYPVPAADHIKIALDGITVEEVSLSVISTTGKVVYSNFVKTAETTVIDVSRLNPGAYILLLKADNDTITRKFIKL